jgi:hypothetical protein
MRTTNAKQGPIKEMEAKGKRAAKEAAYSPTMEKLTRLGYGIKGLIYITIGLLAIQGVLGKGSGTPADQLGAIQAFSKLPFAQVLLWVVLVGLVSYSLWGVVRAVLDPFHHGTDTKGLLTRGGYLISAATYASFVLPTYRLVTGAGSSGSNQTQLVAQVMSMPMGRFLVGAAGLAAIGAGLYQCYLGIKSKFERQFKPYAINPDQYRLAIQIGRFGTIARGIVFAIVGFFFVLAAYHSNPGQAQGIDGALNYLAKQPYGLWLLGIVAIGLIAFGIYSLMTAAWFRLKRQP